MYAGLSPSLAEVKWNRSGPCHVAVACLPAPCWALPMRLSKCLPSAGTQDCPCYTSHASVRVMALLCRLLAFRVNSISIFTHSSSSLGV